MPPLRSNLPTPAHPCPPDPRQAGPSLSAAASGRRPRSEDAPAGSAPKRAAAGDWQQRGQLARGLAPIPEVRLHAGWGACKGRLAWYQPTRCGLRLTPHFPGHPPRQEGAPIAAFPPRGLPGQVAAGPAPAEVRLARRWGWGICEEVQPLLRKRPLSTPPPLPHTPQAGAARRRSTAGAARSRSKLNTNTAVHTIDAITTLPAVVPTLVSLVNSPPCLTRLRCTTRRTPHLPMECLRPPAGPGAGSAEWREAADHGAHADAARRSAGQQAARPDRVPAVHGALAWPEPAVYRTTGRAGPLSIRLPPPRPGYPPGFTG